MILFKEAATLQKHLEKVKKSGKTIGFVPTMGALHDGHISLIKLSREHFDITICSIFVNPTQFTDPEDYNKYPITLSNDLYNLEINKLDILFLPSVKEMYPDGFNPTVHYDLGDIENLLEGKFRPNHFQGVCQIVHKLLNIVHPNALLLGQKDYQQCIVIKQLVKITNMPVKVVIANTLRDETGLAMSSRNQRLNSEQKEMAAGIFKMLNYININYTTTPLEEIESTVRNFLLEHGFSNVDYVAIADTNTLEPKTDLTKKDNNVALIAATMGGVRLIDNLLLTTTPV